MRDALEIVPLSELVVRVAAKNRGGLDRVFTVSAQYGLVDQERFFDKRVASKNLAGYTVVEPGDYVYSKSYSTAAPLGAIKRNEHSEAGVVSPLYIVFREVSDRLVPGFLGLAIQSQVFSDSLAGFLKEGGRAHGAINVSLSDFFSAKVPLPPLAEQRRIIDLIAAVDENIAAAQCLSTATQEAFMSVRDSLLSFGPEVSLVALSGLTSKIGSGATPRGGEAAYKTTGTALIRSQNVYDYRFEPEGLARISDDQAQLLDGVRVEKGDVLINITGASVNRVTVVPDWVIPARVNQHVAIIRPDPLMVRSDFLVHILRRSDIRAALDRQAGNGTTRQALTKAQLEKVKVPVPPMEVQIGASSLLGSLEQQISETTRVVERLRGARAALLADLLSGHHEIPESYDQLLEDVA